MSKIKLTQHAHFSVFPQLAMVSKLIHNSQSKITKNSSFTHSYHWIPPPCYLSATSPLPCPCLQCLSILHWVCCKSPLYCITCCQTVLPLLPRLSPVPVLGWVAFSGRLWRPLSGALLSVVTPYKICQVSGKLQSADSANWGNTVYSYSHSLAKLQLSKRWAAVASDCCAP